MNIRPTRRRVAALLALISLGGGALRRLLTPAWGEGGNEQRLRRMAALADVMFPGEGLPSASALGLHVQLIEIADLQPSIATGTAWLDKYAALQGAADFLALNEGQRIAAIDAAFASREPGVQSFVLALRHQLCAAYYSAPAIKSAFAYAGPPQPDGFADFREQPK